MVERVAQAMASLADRRPLFHSEADFQHALAWEIQLADPTARIRLERRMSTTPRVELDLLVERDGRALALELKYPRAALSIELEDEAYDLRLGAADVECYGIVKDIWRLERLVREGLADEGCVVVVSNNRAIWGAPGEGPETLWDAFRLTDGAVLTGLRDWRETDKKWPGPPIELSGRYELRWRPYAILPGTRGAREFRCLLVPVGHTSKASEFSTPSRSLPASEPPGASASEAPRVPALASAARDPISTAERGRVAARRALEGARFSVTQDEPRRNRLTALGDEGARTVWVATRKGFRYPFWPKTDWQPDENVYVCLVRLPDPAGPPEVYMIPTAVWMSPDAVFVSRDYVDRASPPEWGINLSANNLPALEPYRIA